MAVVLWSLNDLMKDMSHKKDRSSLSYAETIQSFPPQMMERIDTMCDLLLRQYDRSVVLLPDDYSIFAPGVQPARWMEWTRAAKERILSRGVLVLPSRLILSQLERSDDGYHYAGIDYNYNKWRAFWPGLVRLVNAIAMPRGYRMSVALPAVDEFPLPHNFAKTLRDVRVLRGAADSADARAGPAGAGIFAPVVGAGSASAGDAQSVSEAVAWGAGSASVRTQAESVASEHSYSTVDPLETIGENVEMTGGGAGSAGAAAQDVTGGGAGSAGAALDAEGDASMADANAGSAGEAQEPNIEQEAASGIVDLGGVGEPALGHAQCMEDSRAGASPQ
jgi:hypothetical protein